MVFSVGMVMSPTLSGTQKPSKYRCFRRRKYGESHSLREGDSPILWAYAARARSLAHLSASRACGLVVMRFDDDRRRDRERAGSLATARGSESAGRGDRRPAPGFLVFAPRAADDEGQQRYQ